MAHGSGPTARRLRHAAAALRPSSSSSSPQQQPPSPGGPVPVAAAGTGSLVLRDLQKTPLRMGDLMLGCAFNTPNDNRDGLMPAAEADAIATVTTAIEAGLHDLDVSASYGAGRSEEYVGSGLMAANIPGGPSHISLFTKGGPELIRQADDTSKPVTRGYTGERVNLRDFSADGARAAFNESTARLGQQRLAGFRMHDPDASDVDDALAADGFLAGLRGLRAEGLIGQVSLGMNSDRIEPGGPHDSILRLVREAPAGTFNSALLAGGWNLLTHSSYDIMLEAQERGIMM
jgi:D-threo-aldose 1-dehydrogenase